MQTLKLPISENKKIASDTYEIKFDLKNQEFGFVAGQYIWVILPSLKYPDPKGDRRAFSVYSSPYDKQFLSIVFRSSQSGYKKSLLELPVGSEVQIIGPFGFFTLPPETSAPIVFIAGGTGIAPFMSMARSEFVRNSTREVYLFYFNSSKDKAFGLDEMEQLQSLHTNFHFISTYGKADPGIIKKNVLDYKAKIFYVSGPRNMSIDISNSLYSIGIPEDSIRFDQFYGLCTQVSDRSVLEKSRSDTLEHSEFDLAVMTSSEHIVFTDIDGIIKYANPAAEKITGYTVAEMLGSTPRLWGGLMSESFYNNLWRTIKHDRRTFEGEVQNRRKNGEKYFAIAKISPVIDKKDNLLGFVSTENDVTRQRESELRLKEQIFQIEKLNKLMTGREIRMMELKEEIKNLRKKTI